MSKAANNEAFARLAQTELARLGYYRGAIDSWAGSQTQTAFNDFVRGKVEVLTPPGNSARLYAHALKDNGLRELPGTASAPRIELAIKTAASWLDRDDSKTAWCGCIMGLWCKELGLPVPSEYFRAANWLNVGTPVRLEDAILGDIVVIGRTGGNHVALFKDSALTLFGGNQSNSVNYSKFDRSSLKGIRRI